MTITKKVGLVALLASLSWGTQAADFDYNYGQIGYQTGDFTGLALTGSFEVNKDIFVLARYISMANDELGFDVDYDEFSIGAGYHMPINKKTDAVFTVSFSSGEFDAPPGNDDTGVLLTAGVRHNLNTQFELAGGIYHISTFDGDTGLQAEARYNINKKMSAGLTFSTGDYLDGFGLNFRMGF